MRDAGRGAGRCPHRQCRYRPRAPALLRLRTPARIADKVPAPSSSQFPSPLPGPCRPCEPLPCEFPDPSDNCRLGPRVASPDRCNWRPGWRPGWQSIARLMMVGRRVPVNNNNNSESLSEARISPHGEMSLRRYDSISVEFGPESYFQRAASRCSDLFDSRAHVSGSNKLLCLRTMR
jgi:hypothetical protein